MLSSLVRLQGVLPRGISNSLLADMSESPSTFAPKNGLAFAASIHCSQYLSQSVANTSPSLLGCSLLDSTGHKCCDPAPHTLHMRKLADCMPPIKTGEGLGPFSSLRQARSMKKSSHLFESALLHTVCAHCFRRGCFFLELRVFETQRTGLLVNSRFCMCTL